MQVGRLIQGWLGKRPEDILSKKLSEKKYDDFQEGIAEYQGIQDPSIKQSLNQPLKNGENIFTQFFTDYSRVEKPDINLLKQVGESSLIDWSAVNQRGESPLSCLLKFPANVVNKALIHGVLSRSKSWDAAIGFLLSSDNAAKDIAELNTRMGTDFAKKHSMILPAIKANKLGVAIQLIGAAKLDPESGKIAIDKIIETLKAIPAQKNKTTPEILDQLEYFLSKTPLEEKQGAALLLEAIRLGNSKIVQSLVKAKAIRGEMITEEVQQALVDAYEAGIQVHNGSQKVIAALLAPFMQESSLKILAAKHGNTLLTLAILDNNTELFNQILNGALKDVTQDVKNKHLTGSIKIGGKETNCLKLAADTHRMGMVNSIIAIPDVKVNLKDIDVILENGVWKKKIYLMEALCANTDKSVVPAIKNLMEQPAFFESFHDSSALTRISNSPNYSELLPRLFEINALKNSAPIDENAFKTHMSSVVNDFQEVDKSPSEVFSKMMLMLDAVKKKQVSILSPIIGAKEMSLICARMQEKNFVVVQQEFGQFIRNAIALNMIDPNISIKNKDGHNSLHLIGFLEAEMPDQAAQLIIQIIKHTEFKSEKADAALRKLVLSGDKALLTAVLLDEGASDKIVAFSKANHLLRNKDINSQNFELLVKTKGFSVEDMPSEFQKMSWGELKNKLPSLLKQAEATTILTPVLLEELATKMLDGAEESKDPLRLEYLNMVMEYHLSQKNPSFSRTFFDMLYSKVYSKDGKVIDEGAYKVWQSVLGSGICDPNMLITTERSTLVIFGGKTQSISTVVLEKGSETDVEALLKNSLFKVPGKENEGYAPFVAALSASTFPNFSNVLTKIAGSESLSSIINDIARGVFVLAKDKAFRADQKLQLLISKNLISSKDLNILFNDMSQKGVDLISIYNSGQQELLKILLENNIGDINAVDADGNTLLHHAILNGHTKLIESLLQNDDVKCNVQNKFGLTPLSAFCCTPKGDIILAQKLLGHKNFNMKEELKGMSQVPHVALAYGAGNKEIMGALLDTKELCEKRSAIYSILSAAAFAGDKDAMVDLEAAYPAECKEILSHPKQYPSPLNILFASIAKNEACLDVLLDLLGQKQFNVHLLNPDEHGQILLDYVLRDRTAITLEARKKILAVLMNHPDWSKMIDPQDVAKGAPRIIQLYQDSIDPKNSEQQRKGSKDLFNTLVENGAQQVGKPRVNVNVNQGNGYYGPSLLNMACANGDFETIKVLIKNGVLLRQGGVKRDGSQFEQPLAAAFHGMHDDSGGMSEHSAGSVKCMLRLAEEGEVDPNCSIGDGTLLVNAIYHDAKLQQEDRDSIIKALVSHKNYDPNVGDDIPMPEGQKPKKGNTLFMNVCARGDKGPFKAFMENLKLDVEIMNDHGQNALITLAGCKKPEAVEMMKALLERTTDGDADKRDASGINALCYAAAQGNVPMMKLLEAKGATAGKEGYMNVLMAFASEGRVELFNEYAKKYPDLLKQRDQTGNTVLHYAALSREPGAREIFNELIKNPKVDFNAMNKSGTTPLMAAVLSGDSAKAEALLDKRGIEVNFTDMNGNSALHYAASISQFPAVQTFLDHPDIDVNLRNKDDVTPLMLAVGGSILNKPKEQNKSALDEVANNLDGHRVKKNQEIEQEIYQNIDGNRAIIEAFIARGGLIEGRSEEFFWKSVWAAVKFLAIRAAGGLFSKIYPGAQMAGDVIAASNLGKDTYNIVSKKVQQDIRDFLGSAIQKESKINIGDMCLIGNYVVTDSGNVIRGNDLKKFFGGDQSLYTGVDFAIFTLEDLKKRMGLELKGDKARCLEMHKALRLKAVVLAKKLEGWHLPWTSDGIRESLEEIYKADSLIVQDISFSPGTQYPNLAKIFDPKKSSAYIEQILHINEVQAIDQSVMDAYVGVQNLRTYIDLVLRGDIVIPAEEYLKVVNFDKALIMAERKAASKVGKGGKRVKIDTELWAGVYSELGATKDTKLRKDIEGVIEEKRKIESEIKAQSQGGKDGNKTRLNVLEDDIKTGKKPYLEPEKFGQCSKMNDEIIRQCTLTGQNRFVQKIGFSEQDSFKALSSDGPDNSCTGQIRNAGKEVLAKAVQGISNLTGKKDHEVVYAMSKGGGQIAGVAAGLGATYVSLPQDTKNWVSNAVNYAPTIIAAIPTILSWAGLVMLAIGTGYLAVQGVKKVGQVYEERQEEKGKVADIKPVEQILAANSNTKLKDAVDAVYKKAHTAIQQVCDIVEVVQCKKPILVVEQGI